MTFEEFEKVKDGSQCVIIKTGEAGVVTCVNKESGDIRLKAKRYAIGVITEWFHYTKLGKL